MRRAYQGYIYFSFQKEESDWKWIAIRTNKEGVCMSIFGEKEASLPFVKRLQLFLKWIGDVTEYQMVAFGHESYHSFFTHVERNYGKYFPRHLIRLMKAQLWNIKSECLYRFQIKQDLSIPQLLFLYQQDYVKHPNPLIEEGMNLLTLTKCFLFDTQQTKKLMKKSKREIIEDIYRSHSTEQLIKKLTKEGYVLSIDSFEQDCFKVSLKEENQVIQEAEKQDFHEILVQFCFKTHPLNY